MGPEVVHIIQFMTGHVHMASELGTAQGTVPTQQGLKVIFHINKARVLAKGLFLEKHKRYRMS